MDLVTLTDHDTIVGALDIADLPGTFVSEEATLDLPGQRKLHLGVFDVNEQQHARISRLRRDAEAFFAYCAEERIPVCLNHPFSNSTGRRQTADYHLALTHVTLIETRNGMMCETANRQAEWMAGVGGLPCAGGSDAHALATVGRAYTLVPGARDKAEFIDGLRRGLSIPRGRSGSYAKLTADVLRVLAGAYRDNASEALDSVFAARRLAVLLAASPGLPAVPLLTAVQSCRDRLFAWRQFRRFRSSVGGAVRFRPSSESPWHGAPAGSLGRP
jgi:predicted metal-dependent phosphoesterase TrpH